MTGEEFGDFAEGWTLYFETEQGEYFGAEQYLKNNRTIWLPRGGSCSPGVWAEDRQRICFLYGATVSCWKIFADGPDGIHAENADDEGARAGVATRLRGFRRDRAPLLCPDGPGV